MNSTDDLLDKLRKKQAKESESLRQPSRIKEFFKRNSKRFLVAGVVSVFFSVLALTHGIGFTVTVNITSSRLLVKGHPCYGFICDGTMNATFNPFLYPINHLFGWIGSEVSIEFTRLSEPYDSSGGSLKGLIVTETLLSQFPINIPLFYAVGFIVAVGLEKAIKGLRNRFQQKTF